MANLFIMCGLPGAGKTSYAKSLSSSSSTRCKVLSADDVREELYGDASVQGDGKKVFAVLETRVKEALGSGITVYYDCTCISQKGRKALVSKYKSAASAIRCVWLDTPLSVCKERNAKRSRIVPEEVLDSMASRFVPPTIDEGYDGLVRVFPDGRQSYQPA